MAISKIIYKSSSSATPETWMDATGATAAASDITAPKTAMLADGVVTTGTGSGGGNANVSQDANGYIVVDDAAPGGGGGTISTAVDAIKAYLESNGFVLSEFAVQTPESGQYISVPHSLGRIPDLVFVFNKDLQIESTSNGYQLGCASVGNYGVDNNNNRTYTCSDVNMNGSLLYTNCLMNFPLTVGRTQYNFCQSASATEVSLRNASTGLAHMLGTTWILAVK